MKRTHVFLLAILVGVFLTLAAGCGSPDPTATATPRPAATPTTAPIVLPTPTLRPGQPTPTPTPTPLPGAAPPTATPDTGFQAEWDALILAAQEEGKLVVAGGGGVAPMEPIYKIFTDKFGVKVILGRGSSTEHAQRILAEQANGRFTVDVAHSGANSANTRYIANGMAQTIEPYLFHPEVIDKSNWFGGRFWWTDEAGEYHFVMTSNITSAAGISAWWNTNRVSLEEAQAWDSTFSILDPKYRGNIIILSHLVGGATGSDLKEFLDPLVGPEWFETLYVDMDVVFTPDFNVLIDGLSFGTYAIADELGSANTELQEIRDAGGPVMGYPDAFENGIMPGVPITRTLNATGGAGGMLLLMRNLPHPNATKLYVNWILSREGQQAIHDNIAPGDPPGELHNRVSLRRDVTPGLTRASRRWEDGVTYANVDMQQNLRPLADDVYDWLVAMEKARARVPWPFDPETYRDDVLLK